MLTSSGTAARLVERRSAETGWSPDPYAAVPNPAAAVPGAISRHFAASHAPRPRPPSPQPLTYSQEGVLDILAIAMLPAKPCKMAARVVGQIRPRTAACPQNRGAVCLPESAASPPH